eukprot:CAMPEP_0194374094 /NCGR_PEP_ID=MMETSP0174-20130528/22464_1 /TAXON_ID=216777 /ORGANISM="Proboscia alata, Strain PI-D3" /LENGTH=589 /DNA_ID=CAMNT_0039153443 /DNA_START=25 /DNA_END=1794 /DNA_ORIENTATION=-
MKVVSVLFFLLGIHSANAFDFVSGLGEVGSMLFAVAVLNIPSSVNGDGVCALEFSDTKGGTRVWHNTAQLGDPVNACKNVCAEKGVERGVVFDYFGMACPKTNTIWCTCAMLSDIKDWCQRADIFVPMDECANTGADNPNNEHKVCVGGTIDGEIVPTQDGYNLGAGYRIAFYSISEDQSTYTECGVIRTADDNGSDPTSSPTSNPTASPTGNPTSEPTESPTSNPTANPTGNPTSEPTASPTSDPTASPTGNPTSNPTASPTSSSYPTDQGITNINHHSIDNVKCVGKITNDTFVPSVTCSASKFSETKAVMEMKQGNCTGIELVRIENTANDTISVNSGSVDKYINGTNQAFVFCLVVQTFIGNDTEVITEGKTEGTVILNRDLSGDFSLEVSMEAYTTEITSLDEVEGNSVVLRAYQCKNDYSEILNPTEKPQGSTLSVCIVTDQGTSVSLIGVSMKISPSTPNAFTITSIITSDSAENDVLTKFNSHSDKSKVQVKTILVSKYFADTSNTIVVSGTANYNYSSERERRLRVLQSIDDEDISPFDLKIDLKANEAGIFQLSSSTAYNLFHVYGMSALMTCVVTFFI